VLRKIFAPKRDEVSGKYRILFAGNKELGYLSLTDQLALLVESSTLQLAEEAVI
jgi:hypothetical protein